MLLDLEPSEVPVVVAASQLTQRILDLIPDDWVGAAAKQIGGGVYLLALASGQQLADAYSSINYVALQTRIATATDTNLDQISNDFFGGSLPRNQGESDVAFGARVRQAIFQNKATRAGMQSALAALGLVFQIIEDGNPRDIMALGTYGGLGTYGALGMGGWGSTATYIHVSLPLPAGVTQSQIIAIINNVKPLGTSVWLGFY